MTHNTHQTMTGLLGRLFSLAVLLALASCAVWTRIDDPKQTGPNGLELLAPNGWMRYNQAGDAIALTRDGMQIQVIRVEMRPHDKAFPKLKKPSSSDMLPSEAADLLLAELKQDKDLANIKLLDSAPARLGGKSAFRIHGQYRDERGAPFDLVAIGQLTAKGMLVAFYRALSAHYYSRDVSAFEKTVASINIR